MKRLKIENKIIDFIEKHIDLLFIIAITLISMYIRFKFRANKTGDYNHFLLPWFNEIKEKGGFHALKYTIGNYTQPYLTIMAFLTYLPIKALYSIKMVSIAFDYLLGIFSGYFIYKMVKNKTAAIITYALIVLSPLVMLNSALWAQCDVIYTLFIIISLYFLLNKKYIPSFIFLGVSLAFKLQFILILPLYIILYFVRKDFSILNFLLLPITVLVLCIPSIIMGHSIIGCFKVYLTQTTYYEYMTAGMFNFWGIFPNSFKYMQYLGYGLVLIYLGAMLYLIIKNKIEMNNKSIITLGLLSVLVCVFFLPNMHERYLYAGDILSIIWYMFHKEKVYIPIGVNLISFISYTPYLFGANSSNFYYVTFIYLAIVIILTKYFIKEVSIEENISLEETNPKVLKKSKKETIKKIK